MDALSASLLLPVDASSTGSILYTLILCLGNLVGLFGNLLVIAATLSHTTFKMDPGTVVFLGHLAASDVIFTLLYPVVIMVVYAARAWVFGRVLCYGIGLIISLPATANMNFILVMSLYRYIRCKFPMSTRQLTATHAKVACGVMWGASCVFPVYTLAVGLQIVFNPKLAACSFTFPKSTGNVILIFGTTVVPFTVIVTLNVLLWLHVRSFASQLSSKLSSYHGTSTTNTSKEMSELGKRQSRKFRAAQRQGLLTTTLITALFAITWMPTVARFGYAAFVGEGNLPGWVEKIRYFYFIGSWGNPVIYAMINQGFRNYFKKFVNRICKVYILEPGVSVMMSVREDRKCERRGKGDSPDTNNGVLSNSDDVIKQGDDVIKQGDDVIIKQ